MYTVTGTSLANCINTSTSQVFVNSLPTLSVNSATLCNGATATLTSTGALTYTWTTGSNSSSVALSPSATTNYSIIGTDANGCTNSTTTQILVNPNPVLSLNSVSTSICTGNSATLQVSGANTYTWSSGANSSSIVITPTTSSNYTVSGSSLGCTTMITTSVIVNPIPSINSPSVNICAGGVATLIATGASTYTWNTGNSNSSFTVAPAGNTNYTVVGTSAAGCSSSATTAIHISTTPSITVNSSTICAGNSTVLNASGASSYTWNTGATSASISVTPSIATVYTVSGNAPGCSVIASNTLMVLVNPLPIIAANSISICNGSSGTLVASGATSYTWSTGAISSSITANPSTSTPYTVVGNLNGCINSSTALITVNPLPNVTVNSATLCQGSSTILTIAGANTYNWNTGATTSTITVTPSVTTSYAVTGTSSAGCSKTISTTIVVNALPVVNLNSGVTTLCMNDAAATLSGTPTGGTYSGTGVNGNIFTPGSVGLFTITYSYTDTHTCSASSTKVLNVNLCTGIAEKEKNNSIVIFPNPVQDKLQIRNDNFSSNYTVSIYDLNSQQLYSAILSGAAETIDMRNYSKGVYVIRFTENNQSFHVKFIKD